MDCSFPTTVHRDSHLQQQVGPFGIVRSSSPGTLASISVHESYWSPSFFNTVPSCRTPAYVSVWTLWQLCDATTFMGHLGWRPSWLCQRPPSPFPQLPFASQTSISQDNRLSGRTLCLLFRVVSEVMASPAVIPQPVSLVQSHRVQDLCLSDVTPSSPVPHLFQSYRGWGSRCVHSGMEQMELFLCFLH